MNNLVEYDLEINPEIIFRVYQGLSISQLIDNVRIINTTGYYPYMVVSNINDPNDYVIINSGNINGPNAMLHQPTSPEQLPLFVPLDITEPYYIGNHTIISKDNYILVIGPTGQYIVDNDRIMYYYTGVYEYWYDNYIRIRLRTGNYVFIAPEGINPTHDTDQVVRI